MLGLSLDVGGRCSRCFLEISRTGATVSIFKACLGWYSQGTICGLGLNFLQDFWNHSKRWEGTESQGAPVSCRWINTRGFRIWLVRIVSMKMMVCFAYTNKSSFVLKFRNTKFFDKLSWLIPWIPCLFLYFYLQVYELQLYECFYECYMNSEISFGKWWHISEWEVPILLMHAIAVILSEKTMIWVLSSFMKDFKSRNIVFSSSVFICHCLSSRSRGPPIDIPSHEALQPTFEALVYMTLEIGGYCKLFDAVIMLSFHHFKSRSPSFDSVTPHSKLPFDFFGEHVLYLSNAL